MSTLYFETPLTAPNQKFFFRHTVLSYFLGKVPNAQYCNSKIKCVKAKNRRVWVLKSPPPGSYRVSLVVRHIHDYEHLTLNGNDIEWVSEIKHLGNNFKISCNDELDCQIKTSHFIGYVNKLFVIFGHLGGNVPNKIICIVMLFILW